MTKGERLVLTSVVVVNIVIYLVVIILAWDALPQPDAVEEIVVGYFPATPVAVAEVSPVLQPDPPPALPLTSSFTPTLAVSPVEPPTLPPSALACPPAAGWGAYSVQSGDTLFSLAGAHNLTVDKLQVANCLQGDLIQVGQILFLPLPTPVVSPSTTPRPESFALDPLGLLDPGAQGPRAQAQAPGPKPLVSLILGLKDPGLWPKDTGDQGQDEGLRTGPTETPTPAPTDTPLPATAPTPVAPLTMYPDAVNIALLGTDAYTPGSAWRTDTIILLTINVRQKTAGMLSIPRDLWVYIPDYGYNRINTADFTGEYRKHPGGGPALVKHTLLYNLGVPVHYYVRGDFKALIKLIDMLGGIDVAVDCPLEDIFPDPASPDGLYTLSLTSGAQHLDGKAALFYARSRFSTSDFDRSQRQQKVLRGLWDKALQVDVLPKVPELWETLGSAVQTDLSLADVLSLAYVGVQLEPQNLKSRFIGRDQVQGWVAPQGAQVLLPRPAEIQAALVEFFAPPGQEVSALTAEGARVVVCNGTTRPGLAALAADRLHWEGILDVTATDVDRLDYLQTRLTVYADKPLTEVLLVKLFRVSSENIQHIPGPESEAEADIVLVLGYDYNPCHR